MPKAPRIDTVITRAEAHVREAKAIVRVLRRMRTESNIAADRRAKALAARVDDALIYVGTAATLEQARRGAGANKRTWALILAELERRGIKCVDDHLVDFGGAALDGRARAVAALCRSEHGTTRGTLATALGWSGVVLYAAIHRARTLGLVTLTTNSAGRTVVRATGA